jgi:mRNA interferase MazF
LRIVAGDVVRVPFPYVERPARQHRPALVLAVCEPVPGLTLAWVLMITSAANAGWAGDVPIADLGAAGLSRPSIVRTAKVATIDLEAAGRLGGLADADWRSVEREVVARLRRGGPG